MIKGSKLRTFARKKREKEEKMLASVSCSSKGALIKNSNAIRFTLTQTTLNSTTITFDWNISPSSPVYITWSPVTTESFKTIAAGITTATIPNFLAGVSYSFVLTVMKGAALTSAKQQITLTPNTFASNTTIFPVLRGATYGLNPNIVNGSKNIVNNYTLVNLTPSARNGGYVFTALSTFNNWENHQAAHAFTIDPSGTGPYFWTSGNNLFGPIVAPPREFGPKTTTVPYLETTFAFKCKLISFTTTDTSLSVTTGNMKNCDVMGFNASANSWELIESFQPAQYTSPLQYVFTNNTKAYDRYRWVVKTVYVTGTIPTETNAKVKFTEIVAI